MAGSTQLFVQDLSGRKVWKPWRVFPGHSQLRKRWMMMALSASQNQWSLRSMYLVQNGCAFFLLMCLSACSGPTPKKIQGMCYQGKGANKKTHLWGIGAGSVCGFTCIRRETWSSNLQWWWSIGHCMDWTQQTNDHGTGFGVELRSSERSVAEIFAIWGDNPPSSFRGVDLKKKHKSWYRFVLCAISCKAIYSCPTQKIIILEQIYHWTMFNCIMTSPGRLHFFFAQWSTTSIRSCTARGVAKVWWRFLDTIFFLYGEVIFRTPLV